jgi:hypothetical protein
VLMPRVDVKSISAGETAGSSTDVGTRDHVSPPSTDL